MSKMTYGRRYLSKTVVEAAKERMRYLYDTFDSVVVSFSGGKDSIAMLGIAKEVADELGIKTIDVLFYDEELVADSVVSVIRHYASQPWVRMLWVCVPMDNQAMVMGEARQFVPWSPDRKWLRPIPEGATTTLPGLPPGHLLDQREITTFIAPLYPGRLATAIGLRADESKTRALAMVKKKHDNWIAPAPATKAVRARKTAMSAYPIYDWKTEDVIRYIYDRNLVYPTYYDAKAVAELGNRKTLRWSTPLHGAASSAFHLWRVTEPVFYDQLVELFPEMLVQARYAMEIDRDAITREYGTSFTGVRRYIEEKYKAPGTKAAALKALQVAIGLAKKKPALWPPEHVLQFFVTAQFKRGFFPAADRHVKAGDGKEEMKQAVRKNRAELLKRREEAFIAIHGKAE